VIKKDPFAHLKKFNKLMLGLILGDDKLGILITKKLKLLNIKFVIIDISRNKVFKKENNSFHLTIGKIGKAISLLKKYRCKKIILAGKINMPNFSRTSFDLKALYYLPKIIQGAKKGDAETIKVIINIFKKEGFKVISSTHFNPELMLKKTNLTKTKPNLINKRDILKGRSVINNLNNKEAGQAVVIKNGYILAIEGVEGTDSMLNKTKNILKGFSKQKKRSGILLKFPKKKQDLRVDLPTIGMHTLKKCATLGLKGVVLKANKNIFLDRSKCVTFANKNKMFICAV